MAWEAGRRVGTFQQLDQVLSFHEAFGVQLPEDPWTPELSLADRSLLRSHAHSLGALAHKLKRQAAEATDLGRAALGLLLLRLQLHVEETGELAEAWVAGDLVKVLDALSDIGYVNCGTYLTHGLGPAKVAADNAVHVSNMSKLGEDGRPIIAASGRVEKGPNYRPPNLGAVLEALLALPDEEPPNAGA